MKTKKDFKQYIWINDNHENRDWDGIFHFLQSRGITGILFCGDPDGTARMSEQAASSGMDLQAWIITLLNNDPNLGRDHPEWFMMNGLRQSSLTFPPYVDYYRWLCPNNPQARIYILNRIEHYCRINELQGIHLDYIRFPDVILPVACQRQYGLRQEEVEPVYDFCYCPYCLKIFSEFSEADPFDLVSREQERQWVQFRLKTINRLVAEIRTITDKYRKKLTAAVFPTPEIALRLVRQDWTMWNLDVYFPMIYHNFYDKDPDWILSAAETGRECLTGSGLIPGIYLPALKDVDIGKLISTLRDNRLQGISYFDYGHLSRNPGLLI